MGRRLSSSTALAGSGGAQVLLPGQLPTFGTANVRLFYKSGAFVVPAGVDRVRLRVHGGGGRIATTDGGLTGTAIAGGSASVGALISATGGGVSSGATPGQGGIGVGGDFQASGGPGGAGIRSGGGAAGTTLGNGGAGGAGAANASGGGGAVGGHAGAAANSPADNYSGGGASPLEPATGARGGRSFQGATIVLPGTWSLPFPMFAYPGHGGSNTSLGDSIPGPGGGGGGGVNGTGHGYGLDGGGAGGRGDSSSYANGGPASYYAVPGDTPGNGPTRFTLGCGGGGGDQTRAGCGGGGFAYGVFAVNPGQSLTITVGAGALVIVEW